jgi:hypothetical protein
MLLFLYPTIYVPVSTHITSHHVNILTQLIDVSTNDVDSLQQVNTGHQRLRWDSAAFQTNRSQTVLDTVSAHRRAHR